MQVRKRRKTNHDQAQKQVLYIQFLIAVLNGEYAIYATAAEDNHPPIWYATRTPPQASSVTEPNTNPV